MHALCVVRQSLSSNPSLLSFTLKKSAHFTNILQIEQKQSLQFLLKTHNTRIENTPFISTVDLYGQG